MTRWLVTGAAGFIGANFVRLAAAESGVRLVVLDALTYAGNLENIADLIDAGRVEFHRGDICDEQLVAKLFGRHDFDCVVHFAAESHVDRSILGAGPFLRTNIHGTAVLLDAARTSWKGREGKHVFLHVSTDEVFGSLQPDDPPFTEDSPYRPNSPYSASKAASDHLVRAWHHTYGLPTIISNCSNNYGPWQFPEKLIPLTILNALDGRELPVYGDGLQVRDWLHVEDHCRALLAMLAGGQVGRTYVVGGQCERPNIDIVRRIAAEVDVVLGQPAGTAAKLVRHVADRPGHDRRYAMNAAALQREFGWQPRHKLEGALAAVVRWYWENRSWADRIRSGAYVEYYEKQYGARA
jgi:dTDP-glucose 4,6-dehydratase